MLPFSAIRSLTHPSLMPMPCGRGGSLKPIAVGLVTDNHRSPSHHRARRPDFGSRYQPGGMGGCLSVVSGIQASAACHCSSVHTPGSRVLGLGNADAKRNASAFLPALRVWPTHVCPFHHRSSPGFPGSRYHPGFGNSAFMRRGWLRRGMTLSENNQRPFTSRELTPRRRRRVCRIP